MGIAVICPNCHARLTVKPEMAGIKGRCPKCQAKFRVPTNIEAAAALSATRRSASPETVGPTNQRPTSPRREQPAPSLADIAASTSRPAEELRLEVLRGFRGNMQPLCTGAGYRAAVIGGAGAVLVLPVVLLLVITATAAATAWHGVFHADWLGQGAVRTALYVVGLVGGGFALVALVKPLVAPRPTKQHGTPVTPSEQPLLFELVEQLCRLIQTPMPRRILIHCDIETSVRPRRTGLTVSRNDLTLSIGMPLVAALTVQQLAGEIAHGLAPYCRGESCKRLAYRLRTCHAWLARIAGERDGWDARLLRWAADLPWLLRRSVEGLQRLLSVGRAVPAVLLLGGNRLTGNLLRTMAFDADRCQVRLIGNETFEATLQQRLLAQFAYRGMQSDLEMLRREGQLADNLPKLLVALLDEQPEEVEQFVLGLLDQPPGVMFALEPSDAERIAAAGEERSAGVFRCQLPAAVLFARFDQAARQATLDYYRSLFGADFDASRLHPVDELVAAQISSQQGAEARRFFGDAFTLLRPVRLPSSHFSATDNPQLMRAQLDRNRRMMAHTSAGYRNGCEQFEKLQFQWLVAARAAALCEAGLSLEESGIPAELASGELAEEQNERIEHDLMELDGLLMPFESAAGWRIYACLALLHQGVVDGRAGDLQRRKHEGEQLLPVVSSIAGHLESLLELRRDGAVLGWLADRVSSDDSSSAAQEQLQKQVKRVGRELRALHEWFDRIDCPIEENGVTSVARHVLASLPPERNVQLVVSAAQEFVDGLLALYGECVNTLCAAAEEVEMQLGLERLVVTTPAERPAASPSGKSA